ncbi:hypothetical protein [Candidatus Similichlamydia epinepheli]|uniref:hypothetical protein n=1 Tax=Candidatus Similichlamydia epinepheli TaxID=1903953 RepID=UPI000D333BB4|nr:hypothetical protein [Candidatus Similichlamydia epinepheli]
MNIRERLNCFTTLPPEMPIGLASDGGYCSRFAKCLFFSAKVCNVVFLSRLCFKASFATKSILFRFGLKLAGFSGSAAAVFQLGYLSILPDFSALEEVERHVNSIIINATAFEDLYKLSYLEMSMVLFNAFLFVVLWSGGIVSLYCLFSSALNSKWIEFARIFLIMLFFKLASCLPADVQGLRSVCVSFVALVVPLSFQFLIRSPLL